MSEASGREYGRVAFVLACVLALLLAAALLPTLTATFQNSPLEGLIGSGVPAVAGSGEGNLPGGPGSSGGLGSLNPGQSTTVGGLEAGSNDSLRSLGPEIHFTVRSSQPDYWRTGAYSRYTGTGWEQRNSSQPYDGPIEVSGMAGETVSYRVRLNRTATALPTVWRPRTVDADGPISVTGRRAVTSDAPMAPGTTFTATSVRPPDETGVLATAGTDYPTLIEARYTDLPAATPERLTTFTDRLTADADTPYEQARVIEAWLEANKNYSLNASAPESDAIASTFVFEMDRGYCEFFATGMTAMLRTQGIPARYVVGYSTGQPTGENTYTVRGMNAHAWVEMYVPDVGWVRFDPTPGSARLSAEQQALQQERPEAPAYNHTEQGSPGESFSSEGTAGGDSGVDPNGSVTGNGTAPPTDGPTAEGPGEGEGSVTPPDGGTDPETSPGSGDGSLTTPGDTDGSGSEDGDGESTPPDDEDDEDSSEQPASGDDPYQITLSERPVPGTMVTVRVTRAETPVEGVTVLFNGETIGRTSANGTVDGSVPYAERLNVTVLPPGSLSTPALAPPDGRQYAVPQPVANGTNRTFRVETNASISLGGTVATGRTIQLGATVRGVPVVDATIRVDGEVVGRTNANGRLAVTLPEEPGNVTLSVSRDPISGEREIELRALSMDVEPTLPLALPWTDVSVTARLGNETLPNATVGLDGEVVGTTGVNGSLAVTLPLAGSASLSVAQYGQSASASVTGLWTNLAIVLGVFVLLVALVALGTRRSERTPRELLESLADALDRLATATVAVLIGVVDLCVRIGAGLARSIKGAFEALRAFLTGQLSAAALRERFRAWLETVRADARTEFERVRPGTGEGAREPSDEPEPSGAYVTIREAWDRFLGEVSVRQPTTKTPGELATHAIERDDLPAEAVATLRDAFRAVEYGARSPDERLSAVEEAIGSIEAATRDPAEGEA